MSALTRRLLLTRGSFAVAAAGVLSAVPSLSTTASEVEPEAPAVGEAAATETEVLDEPFVAQVRNLQTGDMSLFSGEREIVVKDPALAARLFRATR